jgi:hypothetical protein
MNPEWVVTGIILFGGMAAAGLSLYLKRRKESQISAPFYDVKADLTESEKDKK